MTSTPDEETTTALALRLMREEWERPLRGRIAELELAAASSANLTTAHSVRVEWERPLREHIESLELAMTRAEELCTTPGIELPDVALTLADSRRRAADWYRPIKLNDPVTDELWVYHSYNRGHASIVRATDRPESVDAHVRHVSGIQELEACSLIRDEATRVRVLRALDRLATDLAQTGISTTGSDAVAAARGVVAEALLGPAAEPQLQEDPR